MSVTIEHRFCQSPNTTHPPNSPTPTSPRQQVEPSSPSAESRLKRLDEQRWRQQTRRWRDNSIDGLPHEQIVHQRQQRDSIEVRRRGRAAIGPPVRVMPGGVRLSGGPVLSETEQSMWESEVSSVISIGDRIVLSDTEDELADKQKYRLPDVGKTRLHLRTKEPLSPTPRHPQCSPPTRSQNTKERASTPPSMQNRSSPTKGDYSPLGNSSRNASNDNVATYSDSDFIGSGLSRAGSIYSLSRVSLAGQLSQLTSMRLPDASSLAKRISSIPTSTEAANTLSDASEQIRLWISKASEVLQGLSADDDVEWAAAGGRDGIEDVDQAISRFEKLVDVYVLSIERLQTRDDVASLSAADLTGSVKQMEAIILSWQGIKGTLKGIKEQVEVAMEWEELWNTVLGEIGQEMEGLNRLVFEMEEKRHQGAESLWGSRDAIDLNELETILEEQPGRGILIGGKSPLQPIALTSSPIQPAESVGNKEESSLLALFARMEPLRASLDFLPMRLSTFHIRGNPVFPTACLDLENRRTQLEAQWGKLKGDAESLRRELGEDRWILVFRNAGKQAMKMCDSVTRTYSKLLDAIECEEQHNNAAALASKIESYDAKKVHYGPAIERVLAIIDRGVLDRLTVNGEILRLQSDIKRRWGALQTDMKDMGTLLDEITNEAKERQLRDSVSTVVSTTVLSERSMIGSVIDTPGSSPASSVLGTSRNNSFHGSRTPTPLFSRKMIAVTATPSSSSPKPASRVSSRSSIPQRTPLARRAVSEIRSTPSPAPTSAQWPSRPALKSDQRPKWSSSTRAEPRDFAPLSKFEPSPYAKAPITPRVPPSRSTSSMARRTPSASRIANDPPHNACKTMPVHMEHKSSLPLPATPSARTLSTPASRRPPSRLASTSQSFLSRRRSSSLLFKVQQADGNEADTESGSQSAQRPPSSLENAGRRSSLLPMRTGSRMGDFTTTTAGAERPAWRP